MGVIFFYLFRNTKLLSDSQKLYHYHCFEEFCSTCLDYNIVDIELHNTMRIISGTLNQSIVLLVYRISRSMKEKYG